MRATMRNAQDNFYTHGTLKTQHGRTTSSTKTTPKSTTQRHFIPACTLASSCVSPAHHTAKSAQTRAGTLNKNRELVWREELHPALLYCKGSSHVDGELCVSLMKRKTPSSKPVVPYTIRTRSQTEAESRAAKEPAATQDIRGSNDSLQPAKKKYVGYNICLLC